MLRIDTIVVLLRAMKLAAYLDHEKITQADFAARLVRPNGSIVSQAAVSRYVTGDQIPDREIMPLIVAASGGSVTPNDFFDISPPQAPEQGHDDQHPHADGGAAADTAEVTG